MLGNLTGWHFLILLIVILLLFGAPKLPALARSLGQSMRIFRGEVKTMQQESAEERAASGTTTPTEEPGSATSSTRTSTAKPDGDSTRP